MSRICSTSSDIYSEHHVNINHYLSASISPTRRGRVPKVPLSPGIPGIILSITRHGIGYNRVIFPQLHLSSSSRIFFVCTFDVQLSFFSSLEHKMLINVIVLSTRFEEVRMERDRKRDVVSGSRCKRKLDSITKK